LVGPDGAGKSTLAAHLVDALRELSVEVRHDYWRPGVLPMPGRLVGKTAPGVVTDPHARAPHGRIKATLRLLHYFLDFRLGHWTVYRPLLRRGGVVIVERGWQDLLVDPRRYLMPYRRPAALLGRLLPRPDVIAILTAPVAELHARKQELTYSEIERQLAVWRRDAIARRGVIELDVREPPARLTRQLLRNELLSMS
jgi:thymidylate kinase